MCVTCWICFMLDLFQFMWAWAFWFAARLSLLICCLFALVDWLSACARCTWMLWLKKPSGQSYITGRECNSFYDVLNTTGDNNLSRVGPQNTTLAFCCWVVCGNALRQCNHSETLYSISTSAKSTRAFGFTRIAITMPPHPVMTRAQFILAFVIWMFDDLCCFEYESRLQIRQCEVDPAVCSLESGLSYSAPLWKTCLLFRSM